METDRLVGMVRKGDTEAFGKLVEKYWQYIVGLAFGYVGNVGDAEDVAQDVFVTAYLKIDRLKEDHKFLAWVKTIAVNSAKMHLRSRKAVPNGLFDCDSMEARTTLGVISEQVKQPESEVLQKELSVRVHRALEAIPNAYREVFLLRHFSEMTYKEIAGVLNLPSATVSYRLRHANKLMRRELHDLMSDGMDGISKVKCNAGIIKDIVNLITDGWKLEKAADIRGAEAMYDKASELAKTSPTLHLEIAGRLEGLFVQSGFQKRLGERAIRECEAALSLGLDGAIWCDGCPVEPWAAHAEMALIYLHLRNFDESKKMIESAKRLGQPYNFNEGNWFGSQGMYDEAISFYKRLLVSHGADDNGRIGCMCRANIADSLRRIGKLDESLEEYKALINDGYEVGENWYAIAKIYALKDDTVRFLEALSFAVKENQMYMEWAVKQGMFAKYRNLPEFKKIAGETL